MNIRYHPRFAKRLLTFKLCIILGACSINKNGNVSVYDLRLVDSHHYYAQRIYLDRESDLTTLELTSHYSWIDQFEKEAGQSADEEDLQTAYTYLTHDQVLQAKTLLLEILARNENQALAKILLSSTDSLQATASLNSENLISIKVSVGESWQSLAQKIYGSPLYFYRLVLMNKAKASVPLQPGQTIKTPGQDQAIAPTSSPATSASNKLSSSRIQKLEQIGKSLNPLSP